MSNILFSTRNNYQEILPVPYSAKVTPSVEKPYDNNENLFQSPVLSIANRKNDNNQYCNTISPPPHNQNINVPYEGNTNCPDPKYQPLNNDDACYLYKSNAQDVVGIVCNQAGGSNNANFARGNQFGIDKPYNLNNELQNKKLEYTVENPIQLPIQRQNPVMITEPNDFYPYPSQLLMKNKNFLTYPKTNTYTENGTPTYVYPYKVMNPDTITKNTVPTTIETFNNEMPPKSQAFMLLLLLAVIVLFIVHVNLKR